MRPRPLDLHLQGAWGRTTHAEDHCVLLATERPSHRHRVRTYRCSVSIALVVGARPLGQQIGATFNTSKSTMKTA
jgi:hypothetical protein